MEPLAGGLGLYCSLRRALAMVSNSFESYPGLLARNGRPVALVATRSLSVLSHRPTATVSLCRLYLKLWTITQSDFSGWFLPCSNSSMLSNVFNSSHQGCSNYGPRVSCDPRSSFYWPVANSENIIEYGLHEKL